MGIPTNEKQKIDLHSEAVGGILHLYLDSINLKSGACHALSFSIFEVYTMKKVTEVAAELALPFIEEAGCTLWDVEYVREAGTWFLRVYIDAPGGVNINQCEAVSRPLSDALDEADPIEGSYVLEVSSAGADRPLKKPEHFEAFMGHEVELRLYRPMDGRKEFHGQLLGYDKGDVTLMLEGKGEHTFTKKEIALVRLYVTF